MDARAVHIERVVHDHLLGFEKDRPEEGMRIAYRRVFLEALQAVPRSELPPSLEVLSIMVRACEYASTAAFVEHGSFDQVAFGVRSGGGIHDWLTELSRFLRATLEGWDDLPPFDGDMSQARESLRQHLELIEDITDEVYEKLEEGGDDERGFTVPAVWFKQIEEFALTLACFWMRPDTANTFRRQLEKDSRVLEECQFLSRAAEPEGRDA